MGRCLVQGHFSRVLSAQGVEPVTVRSQAWFPNLQPTTVLVCLRYMVHVLTPGWSLHMEGNGTHQTR